MEESQPAEPTDDAEAWKDLWSIQGDFIYRHHSEPRVQFYVPKEETFSIPLKYIDAARSTLTDLDVMQEKKTDDDWNVDVNRSLSDSWKGFTKFTLLQETPPKGFTWSGERLTKIQTTTRPSHEWPEVWTQLGKAAQRREKQELANEKPKLDNARGLRGIYFADQDDQNYKVTLRNARRKQERPMAAAMPCKGEAQTSTTKVAAKQESESQKIP